MAADRLTDHALVLLHVRPQVIGHRSQRHRLHDILRRVGVDQGEMPSDMEVLGAGEPIIATGAPHHAGSGRFIEVAWPCGCGEALHGDPDRVLGTWARHAERLCGIDAGRLEAHHLAELRGHLPTAVCACGTTFPAPAADALNSDRALEAWEAHVREEVSSSPR
jgi:hypothetical protein